MFESRVQSPRTLLAFGCLIVGVLGLTGCRSNEGTVVSRVVEAYTLAGGSNAMTGQWIPVTRESVANDPAGPYLKVENSMRLPRDSAVVGSGMVRFRLTVSESSYSYDV